MTKKVRNPLLWILPVIFVLAALGYAFMLPSQDQENGIPIAANLPLSGPLSVYGIAVREGVEMYLDQHPQAARRLLFDWQDNASDPATAVRIASRQLEGASRIPYIYVSGVKPQTMAISSEVSRTNIPHFVWIFDADIRAAGSNNFRTWVSYKIEPDAYFEFMESRSARKVAVTYVQLPHTVEEFEGLIFPELSERGIDYTAEVFEFGRTDFREIARRLMQANPDVIILNGFQLELAALVRALRQEPGYDPSKIIGTYDLLDTAAILRPEELEGISVVTPRFSTTAGRLENEVWIEDFREKYGKDPLYTHAFAYDMSQVFDEATAQFTNQETIPNLFSTIELTSFSGITGEVSFDEDGDLITPLSIGVFQNGEINISRQ